MLNENEDILRSSYEATSVYEDASWEDTDTSTLILAALPVATRHSTLESDVHSIFSGAESPILKAIVCPSRLAVELAVTSEADAWKIGTDSLNKICERSKDNGLLREQTLEVADRTKEMLDESPEALLQARDVALSQLVNSHALNCVRADADKKVRLGSPIPRGRPVFA